MSPKFIVALLLPDKAVRVCGKPLPDVLTTLQLLQVAAGKLFPLLSRQVVAVIVSGANHT